MNEQERIQIKFEQNGSIFVKYRTVQFWLWPKDYADINTLRAMIKETVKERYEKRYDKEWGHSWSVPPPPTEYEDMAFGIFELIRNSPNFPIWQVMFV